jgi:hypothetical protein
MRVFFLVRTSFVRAYTGCMSTLQSTPLHPRNHHVWPSTDYLWFSHVSQAPNPQESICLHYCTHWRTDTHTKLLMRVRWKILCLKYTSQKMRSWRTRWGVLRSWEVFKYSRLSPWPTYRGCLMDGRKPGQSHQNRIGSTITRMPKEEMHLFTNISWKKFRIKYILSKIKEPSK